MYKALIIIIGTIFIYSCSNEFDLNETWKDLPVTYSLLNPNDTAQYIRLERVFNNPNTSALEIAKNTDSLYYGDVNVKLIREKDNSMYSFIRIDGNEEGYVRDTGIFAFAPNYLYKINTKDIVLNSGEKYSLIVSENDNDTLTYAKITLVTPITIVLPYTTANPVKFGYIQNFNVTWDGGSNAGYYDLFLTIHLEEKNTTISDEWQNKDLEWKAGEGILSQGHKIVGKNFYIYLQNNLKEDPNIKRKFIGFDIKVRGVGKEFKEYTDILKTNLGITSSQQIPTYTNMSNGYGVFSSISTNDLNGFYLHEQTLDSLKIGIYTKKLNFE